MKIEIKNTQGEPIYSCEATDLREAVLLAIKNGANLSSVDLSSADLSSADLSSANLYAADLRYADLRSADLSALVSGELVYAQTSIVPDSGPFFAWKKCRKNVIVHLAIGKSAKRSNATGRKCRAEHVKVLEVIGADFGISGYTKDVIYRKGEVVRCDKWNDNRWEECGGGIHFFLTRKEAEEFSL